MAVISTIQIDTSKASKSIADLEKELQECTEQLKNVEIGSDAFNELQKKAASAKGQIDQINKTTDILSKGFQGWGENAAKVTAGISGGITAATAAMQLMGVENENVVEGIARLQQLMAFTQGISSLKDLGEAFKNLKTLVGSVVTSLGPLGAILATLAVGIIKVKNSVDSYRSSLEDIAERRSLLLSIENNAVRGYATECGKLQLLVKVSKDENQTLENRRKAIAELNRIVPGYNAGLDDSGKLYRSNTSALDDYIDKLKEKAIADAALAVLGEKQQSIIASEVELRQAEKLKEEMEAVQKEYDAAYKSTGISIELRERYDALMVKSNKKIIENIDALKQKIKDETSDLEEIYKNYGANISESLKSVENPVEEIERIPAESISSVEQYTAGVVSATDALQKLGDVKKELDEQDKSRLERVQSEYSARMDMVDAMYNATAYIQESMSLFAESADGIDSKWINVAQDVQDVFNIAATSIKETGEVTSEAAVGMAGAAIQGIGTVLNNIASEQDTSNKEGFEKSKKLQIAASTMNMIGGIVAALSGAFSTHSGPWDIALAAIQATTIATLGAVQIAKISKMQYDSSNASSATSGINTSAMSSTLVAPTQYSSAVEGASVESSIADSRVYVVESDINQTGNRISVQESENRY